MRQPVENEFFQAQRPQQRRVYDWTLRRYVLAQITDLGRCADVAPASGGEALKPERRRQKSGPKKREGALPIPDAIAAYIKENGPSTLGEIAKGTGLKKRSVSSALHRRFEILQDERKPRYALTDSGRSAIFDKLTVASQAVDYLRRHGTATVEELAKATNKGRNTVHTVMQMHDFFEMTKPAEPAKWGIKD